MLTFVARRSLQTVIVLILLSMIAFMLLQITPGDPALVLLGDTATPERLAEVRHELWLDQPVWMQYLHWAGNVLQGDFGKSISFRENVGNLLRTRIPITFNLGILALLLSVTLSIPAGIISAVRRGTWLDSIISVTANLGIAVPIFWLGIIGIYVFSLKLGWLPVQGYTSPFDNLSLNLKQLVMPAVCLSVVPLASLTRQTRSSMLEVIRQDYIRTARSKGLSERAVIIGHALKNALIPVVTLLGMQVRNLVGGAVLVETVFNIPGMGRLMVTGVFNKDYVVVQGVVMAVGIAVALANFIVDLSYGYLDPRIRFDE